MSDGFFKKPSKQSAVKAQLVEKYFGTWAKIMQVSAEKNPKMGRLAYFDLFCGPGRYEDGTTSVPLAILKRAVADTYLKENLVTFFNDRDKKAIGFLQQEIDAVPGIDKLKFKPQIACQEIDEGFKEEIENMNLVPSFSFLDPWGYKGLSIGLIEAFIKDWGCDCFFFFNYNRISMGMTNRLVDGHINSLLGQDRANDVRQYIEEGGFTPQQRADKILDNIVGALEEKAGSKERYVLPFCFKNNKGTRISHYLIFVSKNFLGYSVMKDIMYNASSNRDQGVADFSYCPEDELAPRFEMTRPLDELAGRLLSKYQGRELTLDKLYKEDSYRTPYVRKNYKEMCLGLEASGVLEIKRPSPRSSKKHVADGAILRFAK